MAQLTQEELKNLFQDFLDEQGIFFDFKAFIQDRGYKLSELGMSED